MKGLATERSRLITTALTLALLAAPMTLTACPVCDTDTGQQVRDGIFGSAFLPTLLAILAPFPVLLGLIALINYALTPRPAPTLKSHTITNPP